MRKLRLHHLFLVSNLTFLELENSILEGALYKVNSTRIAISFIIIKNNTLVPEENFLLCQIATLNLPYHGLMNVLFNRAASSFPLTN